MKKHLFLLFYLCVAAPLMAQNQMTDHSTTVVAYFKQWDQKTYHVKRQQYKTVNGQKNDLDNAQYDLRFTVVQAADDHYAIDARYSNFRNQVAGNLDLIPDSLVVRYGTDEMGTFWQIVNFESVSQQLIAALDKHQKNNVNPNLIAEERAKLASQDYVEGIFIKDIRLLHLPYGMEYDRNAPITAPARVPNLLGGEEPFPATVLIQLADLQVAKKWAKIVIEQQLDQAKLQPILAAWTAAARQNGDHDITQPKVTASDVNIFEVDLESGWLTKALFERTTTINNTEQKDILEMVAQ